MIGSPSTKILEATTNLFESTFKMTDCLPLVKTTSELAVQVEALSKIILITLVVEDNVLIALNTPDTFLRTKVLSSKTSPIN